MAELTEEVVLLGFLSTYLADHDRGQTRSEVEYAGDWPGFEGFVGDHYRLLETPPAPDGTTTPRTDGADTLQSFVLSWRRDQDEGRDLPISHYLNVYVGAAREVARAWLGLKQEPMTVAGGSETNRPLHIAIRGELGHYRLLEQIGAGGQGQVYAALDTRLHRRVALKLLSAPVAGSESSRRRFVREAETASRLQHPGICAVYDLGELQGVPYIAMQLVEGAPLSDYIAAADRHGGHIPSPVDGPFVAGLLDEIGPGGRGVRVRARGDPRTLLGFFERAARALHAAHEAGLIHRDIKPGNIMVGPDGRPVLLDFGLARDEVGGEGAQITRTGDFMGTPSYMSPEQLMAQSGNLDRRTDVYALGVTLYECLTMERPFDGPTLDATFMRILAGEHTDVRRLNADVSKDLAIIVATAIEKDKNRRYQSAVDLADDLRRLIAHEPIKARPVGPGVRLLRWRQRNPVLASFLATMVVVVVVGFAWTIHKNRQLAEATAAAEESAVEARRNARLKERESEMRRLALEEIERLSDIRLLDDLEGEAKRLGSPAPDNAAPYTSWLARARELVARLPRHRATLEAWEREDLTDGRRWRLGLLRTLVEHLQRFADPEAGTVAWIEGRVDFAARVRQETIVAPADAWVRAIDAIADSDVYEGLEIEPQLGLIPLAPDPVSHLYEFVHLQTHEPGMPLPQHDSAGRLELEPATGLVFVLIPGGSFRMGAQTEEPDASNYDPEARNLDLDHRTVDVKPFFISKYEMTQAQWDRVWPVNPSYYRSGRTYGDVTYGALHPVDGVRDELADEVLHELGLVLPTDEQWEYAGRAGTSTVWYTGDDVASLLGHANVADASMRRLLGDYREIESDFDDGFGATAPVGSFRPNAFGLHDVHGNVWEWTIGNSAAQPRLARGGSFYFRARYARSAMRFYARSAGAPFGLRPARSLDR